MKRTVAALVLVLSAFAPSLAHAGGWAVASLDPLPPIEAGQEADVGFRLLQHGRTPVIATDWEGATIGLGVRAGGKEWFAPATMEGAAGHYVATVDVPDGAGTIAFDVQMHNGLQVDEIWTDVPVQSTAAATGSAAGERWLPTWTIPLFALAAVACAAMVVIDITGSRRRRRRLDAAGTAAR